MERISGDGFFSYRRDVERKKDSRRAGSSQPVRSFSSELGRGEETAAIAPTGPGTVEEESAVLLDAVFEAGDRLKRERDTATLVAYREAVKRFLSAVVERGLDIEERTSGSNILRRKRYALVKVVDGKLEQLAAGMIANQREQLQLLARIDEINGLLVDLNQ
ncbi:MAG: YaaR family protein [Spirochaetota bacterium]